MANDRPPAGAFGARLLSGLLDGMTQRYQQGQTQQREDQLYQTQLADKQAMDDQRFSREKELIGHRQDVKTEADEAAKPSKLDREIEQQAVLDAFEKQMRVKADVEFEYDKRRAEEGIPKRGAAGKPKSQADLVSEANKMLINHRNTPNVAAKVGEIAYDNKISVEEAAAIYFKATSEGRDIGGLPGSQVSGEKIEDRRANLVKDLGTTRIQDDYTASLSQYQSVFGEDGMGESEYVLEIADKMMAIDGLVRSGQMAVAEGMTSRMQAIQTVTAGGLIGSPRDNYKDSPTLNMLSPETRQQILSRGVTEPIGFNPDQINARASEATGEDLLLFGGGENPDYEDIIMRMVQNGLSEEIIFNAVKGIFEPGAIQPIESSGIGSSIRGGAQGILSALQSVATTGEAGQKAGLRSR